MWINVVSINFLHNRLRFNCAIWIHRIPQLLRRLEERNSLGWNITLGAGLRIATGARVALPCPEAAEAANLDLIPCLQGSDDGVEESIDDDLSVTASQITEGGHFVYKVGFSHSGFLSYWGRGYSTVVEQTVLVDCRRDGCG